MVEPTLQSVAFPTLDEAQMAELGGFAAGPPRWYRDGQTLIAVGERDFKFLVVNSGEVEIVDHSGDEPRTVAVHHRGQFTGEVALVMGGPAVASTVARGDCEVYEFSRAALKRILNQRPALSDLIIQAFIARRQLLRESPEFTGLRVIGSRYSADTFRVRDFLAKNRVLFTWLDLEGDPAVNQLLQQFGVTEAETPIVACAHCLVLRNPSNRELAEKIGIRRPVDHTVYDLAIV